MCNTLCPRSSDPFYIVTYYIKWGHYFLDTWYFGPWPRDKFLSWPIEKFCGQKNWVGPIVQHCQPSLYCYRTHVPTVRRTHWPVRQIAVLRWPQAQRKCGRSACYGSCQTSCPIQQIKTIRLSYHMSKKSWPILYSNLLYHTGQDMNIQYSSEQEQERSPVYTSPPPIQFIYIIRR